MSLMILTVAGSHVQWNLLNDSNVSDPIMEELLPRDWTHRE